MTSFEVAPFEKRAGLAKQPYRSGLFWKEGGACREAYDNGAFLLTFAYETVHLYSFIFDDEWDCFVLTFPCGMTCSLVTWLADLWHDSFILCPVMYFTWELPVSQWIITSFLHSHVTWLAHLWHDSFILCPVMYFTWELPVSQWIITSFIHSHVTWLAHLWHDSFILRPVIYFTWELPVSQWINPLAALQFWEKLLGKWCYLTQFALYNGASNNRLKVSRMADECYDTVLNGESVAWVITRIWGGYD